MAQEGQVCRVFSAPRRTAMGRGEEGAAGPGRSAPPPVWFAPPPRGRPGVSACWLCQARGQGCVASCGSGWGSQGRAASPSFPCRTFHGFSRFSQKAWVGLSLSAAFLEERAAERAAWPPVPPPATGPGVAPCLPVAWPWAGAGGASSPLVWSRQNLTWDKLAQ